jgi:hypothetical protein
MWWMAFASLGLGTLLSTCMTGTARGPELSQRRSSRDWAVLPLDGGYRVTNNVWNKERARGPYRQAIFTKKAGDATVFGWEWQWPASDGVVAYPEVMYGVSPWGSAPGDSAAGLPLRPGSGGIRADYSISLEAKGIYNMAFEFWTVSALPAAPAGITHEVMIWIANQDMTPAGTWADTFTSGGVTFDMFVRPRHGDASRKNPQQWTYIAFLARTPVLTGPLDISAFVSFLQEKNLLSPDVSITGLELGNEIVTGSGRTEVRDYRVTVR